MNREYRFLINNYLPWKGELLITSKVISKRDKEITERNSADWIIAGLIYS
jgi:hypothetical protein